MLAALRARNGLVRAVREALKGKGLDIRELADVLSISNPGHPQNGRVYISYATGDVLHKYPVWRYFGHFDGHGSDRDPGTPAVGMDKPTVSVDKIVSTLTGPDYPGVPLPPGPSGDL
jgi:hypothetical protein